MTTTGQSIRAARRRMSPDARRAQIVSVAAELFDESSFAAATMDDIAARIGIAKGTLYHYFTSKEEILHAIHEEFIDLLLAHHLERQELGLRPEQLLLEAMADILELMQTHRGHVRVFFEHHRELSLAARQEVLLKRDRYERLIEDLIAQCVANGAFRDVNVHLATLSVFGMCNWAYQWYRPSGALRPREIAYHFWNFIVYGLGSPELRNGGAAG